MTDITVGALAKLKSLTRGESLSLHRLVYNYVSEEEEEYMSIWLKKHVLIIKHNPKNNMVKVLFPNASTEYIPTSFLEIIQ